MWSNKNIKIFINYFLGPLLFLWLSYILYQQVRHQPHIETSWLRIKESLQSTQSLYLLFAFVLLFVNWGLEAVKWQLSVRDIHPLRLGQAFKAVLTGVSVSVTLPNRVGEYLGRMMYMPEGKRLKVISVSVVSSISQLLVTLAGGTVGLLLLKEKLIASGLISLVGFQFALAALGLTTLILTALYFNLSFLERWIEGKLKHRSLLYLIEAVGLLDLQRLLQLLLLSTVRYVVFLIQYLLLFRLFEVEVPLSSLVWIMSLVFLALAVIPTLAVVVEFSVRSEVCLQLVGLFTGNKLGIVLTSVTAWLINLIIPALIGSILILGLKFFRRTGNDNLLKN